MAKDPVAMQPEMERTLDPDQQRRQDGAKQIEDMHWDEICAPKSYP